MHPRPSSSEKLCARFSRRGLEPNTTRTSSSTPRCTAIEPAEFIPGSTWQLGSAGLEDRHIDVSTNPDGTPNPGWGELTRFFPVEHENHVQVGVRVSIPDIEAGVFFHDGGFLDTEPVLVRDEASGQWVTQRKTGLWIDVDLRFPDGVDWGDKFMSCTCTPQVLYEGTDAQACANACGNPCVGWDFGQEGIWYKCEGHNLYGGMEEGDCTRACEGNPCEWVGARVRVNSLRVKIGLVPEMIPGCDMSFDSGVHRWMRNFPRGHAFRQDCFRVMPYVSVPDWQVQLRDTPEDVFHWHGPGIGFSPDWGNCSDLSSAYCTIFSDDPTFPWPWVPGTPLPECNEEIKKVKMQAWEQANLRLRTMVTDALTPRVRQLLTYEAGAGSPFATKPVGPGCLSSDASCGQEVQQHLLPASLTYMAFSWFAAPFRPSDDGRPREQYPIWRVEKKCPEGAHEYTSTWPGVASNGALEPGDCYVCPPFSDACPDTAFSAERVSPTLRVHYLANPDGDNLLAPQDKCPFDYGYNNHATDSDGDTVPDD